MTANTTNPRYGRHARGTPGPFPGDPGEHIILTRAEANAPMELLRNAHSSTLRISVPDNPMQGVGIEAPEVVREGGPFHIEVGRPLTAWGNDRILVGRNAVLDSDDSATQIILGRSANTPGILMIDSETPMKFETEEYVDMWECGSSPEYRVLCLVTDGTSEGTDYEWYELADVMALTNWRNDDRDYVFPLGWVVARQVTDSEHTFIRVLTILWSNTSWIMQGGGAGTILVRLTAQVDDQTYTGDAYGLGRDKEATEEDATIKVGNVSDGWLLPVSPDENSWFMAQKEVWVIEEVDYEYWTIYPAAPATAPVYLTAKVYDDTYTGNVHGNGRHNTATESGVTIKVGAIAADETLPTSSAYAWFIAHKETWVVGESDESLWTIQPEIIR